MSLNRETIASVLQEIADMRGESSVNTDTDRIRSVSKAERNIAGRKLFKWLLKRNATTTGDGSNDYAIGDTTFVAREKGLTEVFVDGTGEANRYSLVTFDEYQATINSNAAARIVYEWYDQANDLYKMHINPAPETGVTITYSYYYMPAKKTSSSDYVYCPNIEALILLAAAYIYENEEEDDKAEISKNEAEQIISELIGLDNSPAVNQLNQMRAIENSTSSHGFGTY